MTSRKVVLFLSFSVVMPLYAWGTGDRLTHSNQQVSIGPFDPALCLTHQKRIQEILDVPSKTHRAFVIAPGEYVLTDPVGLRIPGNTTLVLEGARFLLAETMKEDGQAFLVEDATGVTILGGTVVGQRDRWNPGVNIAGIRIRGRCGIISIRGTRFENLSSNAVGVFGKEEHPVRKVTVRDVVGIDCCNYYGDYLDPDTGPAPGSKREDQGTVAFYHVEDWIVEGCRLQDSRSDGTHFYRCRNGRFVGNTVSGSKMGGYFLEGCENILATGNLVLRNGSRGVTIERDSRFCILEGNLIAFSGREGLWAPDVQGVLVTGNIFRKNGRKNDSDKDCEIRIDDTSQYETVTSDVRVDGNLFFTTAEQTAAVYLSVPREAVVLGANGFSGPAPEVVVEGE